MRKGEIELLAPAGSYEAMVAAVQSGANAVYLGGQLFGARAYATNFDRDELKKAVEYCHLHRVLLYVTVNILYQNSQFEELLEYINYLYSIHVDALIIQDMGLYYFVKKYFPHFEIHISTQASVKNKAGVQYFESQNVDRVVIARETSIDEIEDICHDTNIDIEVFVHGAICMSYSGQCLMSSMIAKRSGNQGACGQPCRLQYEFLKNGKIEHNENKYILSPKDLCSIDHIPRLIEAGVKSFKIEGRMKKPEYVASVVSSYRQAIDAYYKNQPIDTQQAKNNMMKIFNRGFTGGFLWNDKNFVSSDIPGNRGVKVAQIVRYNKKEKKLILRLTNLIHQNDRLYFPKEELTRTVTKMFKKRLLVNEAYKDDIIEIELNKEIDIKQDVYKISDYVYEKELQKYIQHENISLPISMKVIGKINEPLTLTVYDDSTSLTVHTTQTIEKALKTPLSTERIKQQLSKLGNTIYHLDKITIDFCDNGIIPIKSLNDLRREAIAQFQQKKLNKHQESVHVILDKKLTKRKQVKELNVMISNLKQYSAIDLNQVHHVFIPFFLLNKMDNIDDRIIPYIPYLYSQDDLNEFIESDLFNLFNQVLVSDYGALQLIKEKKKVILINNFNLCNDYGIEALNNDFVIPYEMTEKQINNIHTTQKSYFIAYGKITNMNMKHCIISQFYLGKKVDKCNLCKHGTYQLKDRKGKLFDILTDTYCNNYILHYKTLECYELDYLNADAIILNFTNEAFDDIKKIINRYDHIINNRSVINTTNLNTFTGYF